MELFFLEILQHSAACGQGPCNATRCNERVPAISLLSWSVRNFTEKSKTI